MTDQSAITAKFVRVVPATETSLPVDAELWETSEFVAIGHYLQPIRTRFMLLVEENARVVHRWKLIAAMPTGMVDLRYWQLKETDQFETRADLLAATGFVIEDAAEVRV